MGSLTLPDDLPKGKARELTEEELAGLKFERRLRKPCVHEQVVKRTWNVCFTSE